MNGVVWMEASNVQLGDYGDMVQILNNLQTFQTVLQNYTNASPNGPVAIPYLQNLNIPQYYPIMITVQFTNTSFIASNCSLSNLTLITAVNPNNNSTTLTIAFSTSTNMIGLHLEPVFMDNG